MVILSRGFQDHGIKKYCRNWNVYWIKAEKLLKKKIDKLSCDVTDIEVYVFPRYGTRLKVFQ